MADIKELLQAAKEIAFIGGKHTLKYFKKDFEVISKADDSPVTIADRETEQIIREEILKRYPDHGIIGEEFGRTNEDSNIQLVYKYDTRFRNKGSIDAFQWKNY